MNKKKCLNILKEVGIAVVGTAVVITGVICVSSLCRSVKGSDSVDSIDSSVIEDDNGNISVTSSNELL